MTRKECLDAAAECVLKDRASQYGKVENNFERIADLWEAYLHAPISALDVAMMMALLKIARAKANPAHADSFVDLAGYAACGAECASGKPAPKADEEPKFKPGDKVQYRDECPSDSSSIWVDAVYVGRMPGGQKEHVVSEERLGLLSVADTDIRPAPKAEGGCCQNGNDQPEAPEFNFRDKVQARLGDGVWRDAVVSDKEITCGKLWYTVKLSGFSGYYSLQADDVRPAPKAEGCEEPKFKRGDKVEVQMAPDSSTWASAAIMAVYRDKDTCEWRYCVDFEDGWAHVTVPSARVRPVSAPKVEGCEELAEMAEENGNA